MSDTYTGDSVATDSNAGLGTWADGNFEATVSQYGGIGANADVPDEIRFMAGVAQLLQRRKAESNARGELSDDDIAIFVLKPVPPNSVAHALRVPMLDNGLTMVGGRLWFTAAAVVSAHYVELPQDSKDADRFSYVVDQLNLGSQPTLIFDPRTSSPQLRWYPKGLGNPDIVELKPLTGDVSPEAVYETIDRLYMHCLVTPTSLPYGGNLWNDAAKCWPQESAEALVQSHLKIALVSTFPFCTVRHEQTQQTGRNDLEIEEPDPLDRSHVTRHATIELKVLRSFGSTGLAVSDARIDEWIEEGVLQAWAYRENKSAQWSALCCFDMRKEDPGNQACFAHVLQDAATKEINLWRWFLYSSSANYREAMDNQGLGLIPDD